MPLAVARDSASALRVSSCSRDEPASNEATQVPHSTGGSDGRTYVGGAAAGGRGLATRALRLGCALALRDAFAGRAGAAAPDARPVLL